MLEAGFEEEIIGAERPRYGAGWGSMEPLIRPGRAATRLLDSVKQGLGSSGIESG